LVLIVVQVFFKVSLHRTNVSLSPHKRITITAQTYHYHRTNVSLSPVFIIKINRLQPLKVYLKILKIY